MWRRIALLQRHFGGFEGSHGLERSWRLCNGSEGSAARFQKFVQPKGGKQGSRRGSGQNVQGWVCLRAVVAPVGLHETRALPCFPNCKGISPVHYDLPRHA